VCVAILAAVAIPTAAVAAVGTFTSTTVTPAVTATNSATVANAKGVQGSASATSAGVNRYGVTGNAGGTFGIGVQGTGTKYGVFSNGPLGVAAGKSLTCAGCVGPGALSAAARVLQPLGSGQSESGTFVAYGGTAASTFINTSITYQRPLAAAIPDANAIATTTWPVTHCSGPGSADAGYLCMYEASVQNATFKTLTSSDLLLGTGGGKFGEMAQWSPTANGAFAVGSWTVTAP
jgi:hypothetical protein